MAQCAVPRHRPADGVDDMRVLDDRHTPAGLTRANAKLDVLTVEAEPFVERPGGNPDLAANGHRRAADPIDVEWKLLSVPAPEETGKPPCPADDADHPWQRRCLAAAPLGRTVFIHQPRSGHAEGGICVECGDDGLKRALFNDGVTVEQQDNAAVCLANPVVRRRSEATV